MYRLRRRRDLVLLTQLWAAGCTQATVDGPSAAEADAGAPGPDGAVAVHCEPLFATLTSVLEQEHAAQMRIGGSYAAVSTADCGEWAGAAGDGATTDQLLRVGSVTKTYTAAAVLTLMAEGEVSLEDPLSAYVEGFPNGDTITVRSLLNHTSGAFDLVRDQEFMTEARSDPSRAYTPAELIQVAIDHGPDFEPGTDWSYSNTNYILLGMVIEAATGSDAASFIRSRLVDPLGLQRTYLDGADTLPEPLAPGHSASGEDVTISVHPSVRWTAGSMVADVVDLAAWTGALYRGEVLPEAQQEAMLDGVPTGPDGASYGLGASISSISGVGETVGHGGDVPGYHTLTLYVPALDLVATAIVNSDRGDAGAIVNALITAVDEAGATAP